jgi:hypothetical protein
MTADDDQDDHDLCSGSALGGFAEPEHEGSYGWRRRTVEPVAR